MQDNKSQNILKSVPCARCKIDMSYKGTKDFHEGTRRGVLGDFGEIFVNKEQYDVYVCPKCGCVEFFIDGVGEDYRMG